MRIIYDKYYPKKVYGIEFLRRPVVGFIKKQWIFIIYYGHRYKAFSNYNIIN